MFFINSDVITSSNIVTTGGLNILVVIKLDLQLCMSINYVLLSLQVGPHARLTFVCISIL